MSTETATITGTRRDKLAKTGEGFIDVEVTYELDGKAEVRRYAYPLESTEADIKADIKRQLATRKSDRENVQRIAENEAATAEATKLEAKADKTVTKLEGITVK